MALSNTKLELVKPTVTNPRDVLSNQDIEAGLLGCVFQNPNVYPDVATIVKEEDFFWLFNRYVWQTFAELTARGDEIDILLVNRAMEDKGVGDMQRLVSTQVMVGNVANASRYAYNVRDMATKRRLYTAITESSALILDPNTNNAIDMVAQQVQSKVFSALAGRLDHHGTLQDELQTIMDEMELALQNPSLLPVKNVPTGFIRWDKAGNALKVGELTVLMNYTGGGKTTLAIEIARQTVLSGGHVLVISREMTKGEIMNSLIAIESGLPKDVIHQRKISNAAVFDKFVTGAGKVSRYADNIHIHDKHDSDTVTPLQVQMITDSHRIKYPIHLVIIDGLWLLGIDHADSDPHNMDEYAMFAKNTKDLQRVASRPGKESAILLLHQYNQNMRNRPKSQKFPPRESDAWGGIQAMFHVPNIWGMYSDKTAGVPSDEAQEGTMLYNMKDRNGNSAGHHENLVFINSTYKEAGSER